MSDLISRQAAIYAIRKHEVEIPVYTPRETDIVWNDAIDCCVQVIDELPSARPKGYVKDGTLTIQMPTIKDAIAVDKVEIYADTYKQEYFMPIPRPTGETKTNFCESQLKLINASDLIEWIMETDPDWCVGAVRSIVDHIDKMPTARPKGDVVNVDYDAISPEAVEAWGKSHE